MALDLRKINPELDYLLKEVAQILEISYQTVRSLRKQGKLKAVKIGNKYYVKGKDILAYIEGN